MKLEAILVRKLPQNLKIKGAAEFRLTLLICEHFNVLQNQLLISTLQVMRESTQVQISEA